jgi:hypothetical protein
VCVWMGVRKSTQVRDTTSPRHCSTDAHRSAVSQLALERISFRQFLAMSADDLRGSLNELPSGRARGKSPLDDDAIESLIRVMDRAGHPRVSALGVRAARAWAARIGIS